jgi:hypothetical protein
MAAAAPTQLREYFLITPDGHHVVTRYWAASEGEAWDMVRRHFCQPSFGVDWSGTKLEGMRRDGFKLTDGPPDPVSGPANDGDGAIVRGPEDDR